MQARLVPRLGARINGPVDTRASTRAQAMAEKDRLEVPGSLDIQGHRGALGLEPENTLPSFELMRVCVAVMRA